MILTIIYTILVFLGLILSEGFLFALFGFRLSILLVIFFAKKVDWKLILVFVLLLSFIFDIGFHFVLGTNALIFGLSLIPIFALSSFIPLDGGYLSFIPKFLSIFLFYILLCVIPDLLSSGVFGNLSWDFVLSSLVKSVIAVVLSLLFESLWDRFRSGSNSSKVRLR